MAKNSKIIIADNIRVDKDYINVFDGDMLTVVNAHAIATANNYSFIRKNRSLKVNFTYAQCVQANYMAFQNPDYSNRWFFAWIDSIEYVGENTVEINFTIDSFSTWWNTITRLPVFVERENVNDDIFGSHTLPEPIKADMMINQTVVNKYYSNFSIIVFYTYNQISPADLGYALNNVYYTPCEVNRYDCSQSGIAALQSDLAYGNDLNNANIITINVVPNDFLPAAARNIKYLPPLNIQNDTIIMPIPTDLNGYVPVNKKCLMYPYNMITVNNGNVEKTYKYEKFANMVVTGGVPFLISCGVLPNGAGNVYPMNYDGRTGANVAESLTLGDLPMVAFPIDSYGAWLAQKSSGTVVQGIMSTLTGAIAGGLKGGYVGAAIGAGAGLIGGVSNYIAQEETARSEKDNIIGTNNVDLDMVNGYLGFSFTQKCIISDDAERIDRFFSQFGYNVSVVKQPNYTGRTYWNYVKINGSCGYGQLPEADREQINRILNKGVTIWHDHATLGNYFAGGSKMENPVVI